MENYLKKELYELIRNDERIFDFIQESSLDGLWYWDLEKPENEWMNARFWTTLGYSPDEMPHSPDSWQSIINSTDLKTAIDNFEKHLKDPAYPYDQIVRYTHKNGSTVWIRCRGMAIRDEKGTPLRMLGAHHDITDLKNIEIELVKSKESVELDNAERRKAEKELIQTRDLLRYIIEHNRSAVAVHDRDLRYIYVSQRYLQDYKVKEKDVIGMHHYDVFPDLPQKWRDVHQKALQGIVSSANDDAYVKDDGTTEWTRWECRPWYESDGIIGGIIVYTEVTSERKKLEYALLHKNMELEASEEEIRAANEELLNASEQLKKTNEELKLAKEKAEENAQHLTLLIEHAPEAIFIQTDMKFAYLNRLAINLFGFENEAELLHSPVPDRFHPDCRELVKDQINLFRQVSQSSKYEQKIIQKNGSLLYVDISAVPFVHQGKEGALVFVRNVTEHMQYEEKLKKSYELLKNLTAQVPGVVYQYRLYPDGHSAFPFSSRGMYEIYEVTSEEVKEDASLVFTRIHPDDYNSIYESIQESAKNQTLYRSDFRVILPKQGLRWRQCEARPELLEDGSTLWYGIITDITDRKIAEEKIKEQQLLFETMFNTITDGVIITNKESKIQLANKGMELTFGYKPEEITGKTTEILYADSEDQIPALGEMSSGNIYLTHYKDKRNVVFSCETFGSKLFDSKGSWIGNLAIMRNISERVKYISDLKIAREKAEESDRLKTAFLHNISHEIRTPMNAIIGFSEFLNNPNLTDEKRKKFTDLIILSSNQLLSIITDIVNIATIEAGQVKVEQVETSVNNLLQLLQHQYQLKAESQGIRLIFTKGLTDRESLIYTDSTKLTEILSNLIGNAIKFTSEGSVNFGYELKNNFLEFYVHDTGIGIPEEMHQDIFQRFRQVESTIARQFGGSGLGLSISKAYIELLGGKIWLKSSAGNGSVFYFTIPYRKVYTEKKSANIEPEITEHTNEKTVTILIAEDNDSNFMYLEELLSKMKAKIIRAYNGIEAVEYCKYNDKVDIVLMDMKMPLMDGYEAARNIRQLRPDLPVIAQTAYSIDADIKKAYESGCVDTISKPINADILLKKIKLRLPSGQN